MTMPNFLKKMLKSTSAATGKFLDYNGLAHLIGKLVKVDATLTQSGQAADAKVVGDKVKSIQTSIGEVESLLKSI